MDVTRRYLRKYALAGSTLNTPIATTYSNVSNNVPTDDVPGKRDKDLGKDEEGNDVVQSKNGKVYRKKNGIWEEYTQEGEPYKEGDGAGPRGISGSYTIPSDGSSSSANEKKVEPPSLSPTPAPTTTPAPVPPPSDTSASSSSTKDEKTSTSTNNSSTSLPQENTKPEQSISKKEKRKQRRRERRLARDLDAVPAEDQGKKQVTKPDTSQEQQTNNQQQGNSSLSTNNNNNLTDNGVKKEEVTLSKTNNTQQSIQQQTQNTEPQKIEPIKVESIKENPIQPKEAKPIVSSATQNQAATVAEERKSKRDIRRENRQIRRKERQERKNKNNIDSKELPQQSQIQNSNAKNVEIRQEVEEQNTRQFNSNSRYTFPSDATDIDLENGTYKDTDGNLRAAPEKKKEIEDKVEDDIRKEQEGNIIKQNKDTTDSNENKSTDNANQQIISGDSGLYANKNGKYIPVKENPKDDGKGEKTYVDNEGNIYHLDELEYVGNGTVTVDKKNKKQEKKQAERIEKREKEIDNDYQKSMEELDKVHDRFGKDNHLTRRERRIRDRKLRRPMTEIARRYFGVFASSDRNKKEYSRKLFGKAKKISEDELTEYDRESGNTYPEKQTRALQFTREFINNITDGNYASKENTNAFLKNFKELKRVGRLFRIPRRSDREVVYNIFNDMMTGKGDWLKYYMKNELSRPIDKMRINRIVRRNNRFENRLERRANRNN